MTLRNKVLSGAAAVALSAFAMPALADGYSGSVKDAAPAAPERQFTWSVNGGITSDYVFRGFSQNDEDPTPFIGADIGYGIFYAGVWAAEVDDFFTASSAEIDLYAGIKPVLGPVTFDLGIIYYGYADQADALTVNVDYWEFKAGASITPFTNASVGAILYYSPDYTFETGEVFTVEGVASYTLPTIWIFTPTIGGTVGYQTSDDVAYENLNGFDEFMYWNAGLTLGVEKVALDFRYWDTDVEDDGLGRNGKDLGDEKFVFTVKVTLP
ncbi:MAG: TorF family putative porin [Hyphomicrobiaceae bacterium]|nr:TorF family putative porin [Hyphomicrobiaceae bacterium]